MYQQEFLAVASFEEAAKMAAIAIAAAKDPRNKKKYAAIVGHMLFPDKDPDAAGRYFMDCLNPERPEKLAPSQIFLLARMAKRVGCHILHAYMAEECEYQMGTPIEPKDEAADLVSRTETLLREFRELVERLDKVNGRMSPPMVR